MELNWHMKQRILNMEWSVVDGHNPVVSSNWSQWLSVNIWSKTA